MDLEEKYGSETGNIASRIIGPETSFYQSRVIHSRDYVEWLEKKLIEALDNKKHLAETRKITDQLRKQLVKDGLITEEINDRQMYYACPNCGDHYTIDHGGCYLCDYND